MRQTILLIALLGVLVPAAPSGARAGAANGIGLTAGPVHRNYRLAQDLEDDLVFTSTGLGVAADAQFAFDDTWTVNPALQFSYERTTHIFNVEENTEGRVFAYAALFQVRYWHGDAFAALHLGVYQEVFRSHSGQVFERGYEGGGAAIGWEGPDGLTVALQGELESASSTTDRVWAARLNVGYRWD